MTEQKQIRCAIYTRKSSDEGLEQEFNSLDAQRLSGESYIKSQSHEGWIILKDHYDDGGYSGGNTNRPALQKLFADIKAGKIDMIVVYKIDRLSRSLIDFVKIIELFDEYSISFVSVTQSFNTADSMGRLMLNVLFSFAQYEREITAERIRDKIGASKKKGMWMGGNIPLGYNSKDKKLIINNSQAQIIKEIFQSFLELQSVIKVARAMNTKGYKAKALNKKSTGSKFDMKNIRKILTNPVYIGKIKHKDAIYNGIHKPIIDTKTWQDAQSLFGEANRVESASCVPCVHLLTGILLCGSCNCKMTPTYTKKGDNRYYYYICAKKYKGATDDCFVGRVSASEIEQIVIAKVLSIISKPEMIAATIDIASDNLSQGNIVEAFKDINLIWQSLSQKQQSRIIALLIQSITISEECLVIKFFKSNLLSGIEGINQDNILVEDIWHKDPKISIVFPEGIEPQDYLQRNYNHQLIRAFARANRWQSLLKEGKFKSLAEIAKKEKVTTAYITKLYKLNYVAPEIVEAIIEGRQPRKLCLQDFMRDAVPEFWMEQFEVYGFKWREAC